jgi:hypothetical protein
MAEQNVQNDPFKLKLAVLVAGLWLFSGMLFYPESLGVMRPGAGFWVVCLAFFIVGTITATALLGSAAYYSYEFIADVLLQLSPRPRGMFVVGTAMLIGLAGTEILAARWVLKQLV